MHPRSAGLSIRARPNPRASLSSVCPTCVFARAASLLAASAGNRNSNARRRPTTHHINPPKQRHASTLASSTAVNATKEIPRALRQLHAALERLKKDAPNHANLSRLQLALRSLESGRPTIRLAVLGLRLRDQQVARRLARLVLADVLSEQGDWEARLDAFAADDGRALLLRYGEETDLSPSNPQVMTLNVPSRVLRRHNMEVLVSSLNVSPETPVGNAGAEELRRAALVPTAETPSSFTGGVSFITYPVHRAIILGEGLQGCMSLGGYAIKARDDEESASISIHLASNFPELSRVVDRDAPEALGVTVTDVAIAEDALAKFRESVSNASIYERQWNESGLPQITQWLSKSLDPEGTETIDPAVKALINDLVDEVYQNVAAEDEARLQVFAKPSTIDDVRQPINESLQAWAKRAHLELRDQLDAAFSSDKWAKLRWWKLAWRVDDVTMIMTELVERSWLVEAEKGIIWLSGRSAEAGIYNDVRSLGIQPPAASATEATSTKDKPKTGTPSSQQPDSTPTNLTSQPTVPWPIQIPLARRALQTATIPTLQSLSQALLLQTMSVTALTSALSALIYVSFPGSTLYSAGALAAVGLTWSLRRLQRTWEAARSAWEAQAREGGRVVLKDVERGFRETLLPPPTTTTTTTQGEEDERVEGRDGRVAVEAAERVRGALDELSGARGGR